MRGKCRMPKTAWSVLAIQTMLSAAMIAGCDSSSATPEQEAAAQASKEATEKRVEELNAQNKKKLGKNAPTLKFGTKPGAGVGKAG
jgi:heat shock protein HslJ